MSFFRRKEKFYYGLDVGNGAVKLVELRRDSMSERPTLQRFLVRPTPLDSLTNGMVKRPSELRAALKSMLRELGLRSLTAATALTGQNLIVRQLDLPQMPEDELRQVIRLQADNYFGIPAVELTADFQLVQELPQNRMRVLLVGSQKQPLIDFADFIQTCGIKVARIDIEPLAALRSLRFSDVRPTEDSETIAILDLGAGTSNLSVFQATLLQMVRIIPVGGNDFTATIVTGLNTEREAAEELKYCHGVIPTSPIFKYLSATLQRLLQQVSLSLEYYQAEHPATAIQRLHVIGGASYLSGLREALSESVSKLYLRLELTPPAISIGDPCSHLELQAGESDAINCGPTLAVAIGLALGEVFADAAL